MLNKLTCRQSYNFRTITLILRKNIFTPKKNISKKLKINFTRKKILREKKNQIAEIFREKEIKLQKYFAKGKFKLHIFAIFTTFLELSIFNG